MGRLRTFLWQIHLQSEYTYFWGYIHVFSGEYTWRHNTYIFFCGIYNYKQNTRIFRREYKTVKIHAFWCENRPIGRIYTFCVGVGLQEYKLFGREYTTGKIHPYKGKPLCAAVVPALKISFWSLDFSPRIGTQLTNPFHIHESNLLFTLKRRFDSSFFFRCMK